MRYFFLVITAMTMLFACTNEAPTGGDFSKDMTASMTKTENGFAYEMHKDVEGDVPETGYLSIFNLTQRFDDTIVYSSAERGREERIVIPTNAAMRGKPSPVIEILKILSPGDSASIYVVTDSLGPNLKPWQLEKNFLIYDIAVSDVKNLKDTENAAATTTAEIQVAYKAGTLENIQTAANGLKYVIIEEGTGVKAESGKVVSVDYYGVTAADGTMFDNSFGRGEAYRFPLGAGRVIKGWDTGIEGLKQGTKAALLIPADLAYGEAGSPPKIAPNSELIFYIELQGVE
ncbi:MAG: FKBP-type peptidyl-prolyl cis-trans isomerase FkpA [Saprospiraceae bacterium]|jgi:FKBP-type peptidyl-prolyl cis-trans isomerase FkpA